MSTNTLSKSAALDFNPGSAENAKKHRWWNPFTRVELPRGNWIGNRRRAMDEMREEQRRLVETLDKLNERLNVESSSTSAKELDPMPVIRGIESISAGQQEISAGIVGLNRFMERAGATNERLSEAVTHVGQTLDGVRSTQADTVSAVSQVGERIQQVTARFESLFKKMQDAEAQMAADYRKLQTRTLMAIGGIATSAIIVLAIALSSGGA